MRYPTALIAIVFAGAGLVVASTALGAEPSNAKDAPQLEGYVRTGGTKDCLNARQIDQTQILNNRQILFRMSNGDSYLNEPAHCTGMRKTDVMSYELTNGSLCSLTIVHLLDRGVGLSMKGSCGLDQFQKLEKRTAAAE